MFVLSVALALLSALSPSDFAFIYYYHIHYHLPSIVQIHSVLQNIAH